ncbi:MAG: vWA domain-containing protein [Candidatus Cybelea sp.]|jgi:uncharacterized protein with von Willebrand factor type A (vWA) domain
MNGSLTAAVVEFCSRLRGDHEFIIGPREAREALRAIETVGVESRGRVAAALRTICCSRAEEIEPFDRAFAAFFSTKSFGIAQPKHAERRRTRPNRTRLQRTAENGEAAAVAPQPSALPQGEDLAQAWQVRRARYSPAASAAGAIAIPTEGLDAAFADAERLIARLHLVRSLRWKPQARGERFDLRRTLRASLRTAGDVVVPHRLGHPLRDPRFVLLLDGSRSMAEHGPRMLQFAYALCRRTRRASVFLFSTKLRDVTRKLRDAGRGGRYRLDDLGEAWGGGTRIGASLAECVRKHGAHLGDRTFVIVISDGLDVGDIPQLKHAMRELARRCAAIAWVNPHAGEPSFTPSASGMQAALPYLNMLASLDELRGLANLGKRRKVTAGA